MRTKWLRGIGACLGLLIIMGLVTIPFYNSYQEEVDEINYIQKRIDEGDTTVAGADPWRWDRYDSLKLHKKKAAEKYSKVFYPLYFYIVVMLISGIMIFRLRKLHNKYYLK